MSNAYPQYFNLSDENEETLKGVVVVAYNLNTGVILERATTDQSGRVAFNTVPGDAVGYRPEITRRAGKHGDKSIGGAVRLTPELRKIQENITPEEFGRVFTIEEPPKPPSDDQKPFTIRWVQSAPPPCSNTRLLVNTDMYRQPLVIMADDEVDRSVGWVMVGNVNSYLVWDVSFDDHGHLLHVGYIINPNTPPPTLTAVRDCTVEQIGLTMSYRSRPVIYFDDLSDQLYQWRIWKLTFSGPQPQVSANGNLHVRGLFVPCPGTKGDWTVSMDSVKNTNPAAEKAWSLDVSQEESHDSSGGLFFFYFPDPKETSDHGTMHFNGDDIAQTASHEGGITFGGVAGKHNGEAAVDWDDSQSVAGFSLRFTSCKGSDPTQHIVVDAANLPSEETRLLLIIVTLESVVTMTGWDLLHTTPWVMGDTTYYIHHLQTSYDGSGGLDEDTGIDPCTDMGWSLYNLNPFNGAIWEKESLNLGGPLTIDYNVEFGLVTVVSTVAHGAAPVLTPTHANPINQWKLSGGTRQPGLDFKIYTYVGRDSNNWKATDVYGLVSAFKLTH